MMLNTNTNNTTDLSDMFGSVGDPDLVIPTPFMGVPLIPLLDQYKKDTNDTNGGWCGVIRTINNLIKRIRIMGGDNTTLDQVVNWIDCGDHNGVLTTNQFDVLVDFVIYLKHGGIDTPIPTTDPTTPTNTNRCYKTSPDRDDYYPTETEIKKFTDVGLSLGYTVRGNSIFIPEDQVDSDMIHKVLPALKSVGITREIGGGPSDDPKVCMVYLK